MSVECRRLYTSVDDILYADKMIAEARTRPIEVTTFPIKYNDIELICLTRQEAERLLPEVFKENDGTF